MASPIDSSASIKRIAWAFGCAKKDSEEEARLYRLLKVKLREIEERYAVGGGA